jgi:hypothetical protein
MAIGFSDDPKLVGVLVVWGLGDFCDMLATESTETQLRAEGVSNRLGLGLPRHGACWELRVMPPVSCRKRRDSWCRRHANII